MIGPRTAVLLGALFLSGFGVNLWMVTADKKARLEIELVDQPTALGDENYFKPPPGVELKDVTMRVDGRLLASPERRGIDFEDGFVRRSVVDDSGMFILYEAMDRGKSPNKYENSLFLKLGKDEFLRLEYVQ